jgi:hypothetical protein
LNILLDENLPEALIAPLRALGHATDSIGSLKLKGLDNGRLYREIASDYDLFFTKDRDFGTNVGDSAQRGSVKVVVTVIRQQPAPGFVAAFIDAFVQTDWAAIPLISEWPVARR